MKRFLSLLLAFTMLFMLAVPANAAVIKPAEPQYTHISSISAELTIDEFWGIAHCYSVLVLKNNSSLKIVCKLQVYKDNTWQTLKTWENSGTTARSAGGDYAIYKGYLYRTYVTGYVYNSMGVIVEAENVAYTKWY